MEVRDRQHRGGASVDEGATQVGCLCVCQAPSTSVIRSHSAGAGIVFPRSSTSMSFVLGFPGWGAGGTAPGAPHGPLLDGGRTGSYAEEGRTSHPARVGAPQRGRSDFEV